MGSGLVPFLGGAGGVFIYRSIVSAVNRLRVGGDGLGLVGAWITMTSNFVTAEVVVAHFLSC